MISSEISFWSAWCRKGTIAESDYIEYSLCVARILKSYLPSCSFRPYITTKIYKKPLIIFLPKQLGNLINKISFANATEFYLNMIIECELISDQMNILISYSLMSVFSSLMIVVSDLSEIGKYGRVKYTIALMGYFKSILKHNNTILIEDSSTVFIDSIEMVSWDKPRKPIFKINYFLSHLQKYLIAWLWGINLEIENGSKMFSLVDLHINSALQIAEMHLLWEKHHQQHEVEVLIFSSRLLLLR